MDKHHGFGSFPPRHEKTDMAQHGTNAGTSRAGAKRNTGGGLREGSDDIRPLPRGIPSS